MRCTRRFLDEGNHVDLAVLQRFERRRRLGTRTWVTTATVPNVGSRSRGRGVLRDQFADFHGAVAGQLVSLPSRCGSPAPPRACRRTASARRRCGSRPRTGRCSRLRRESSSTSWPGSRHSSAVMLYLLAGWRRTCCRARPGGRLLSLPARGAPARQLVVLSPDSASSARWSSTRLAAPSDPRSPPCRRRTATAGSGSLVVVLLHGGELPGRRRRYRSVCWMLCIVRSFQLGQKAARVDGFCFAAGSAQAVSAATSRRRSSMAATSTVAIWCCRTARPRRAPCRRRWVPCRLRLGRVLSNAVGETIWPPPRPR